MTHEPVESSSRKPGIREPAAIVSNKLPVRPVWKGAVLAAALLSEGVLSRFLGVPLDPSGAVCISYGLLGVTALVLFLPSLDRQRMARLRTLGIVIPVMFLIIPELSRPGHLPLLVICLISSIAAFLPGSAGRAGLDGVILVIPPLLLRMAGLYPAPLTMALLCALGYLVGEGLCLLRGSITGANRLPVLTTVVLGPRGTPLAAWLVVLSFALLLFSVFRQPALSIQPGRVIIDQGHGSTEPATVDIGESGALRGNFGHGRLVSRLKEWGYSVTLTVDELTPEVLGQGDVLVLICPSRPYSWNECKAVREFVFGGGGVLGIGEHTDLDGVMSCLNPVFEPLGLRLACDAVELPTGTGRHLGFARHPALSGIEEISVSTGASLAGPAMTPLIWTRSGTFSDAGRWIEGLGMLGNRHRDPGEKVGFQVLAGSARFGRGKAVLLGDSSYFQNTNLFCNSSLAWSLFGWLSRSGPADSFSRELAVSVLIIITILLSVVAARFEPGSQALLLVVPLVLSVVANHHSGKAVSPPFPVSPSRPVVALDLAHFPRFDLYYRTGCKKPGAYVDSVCLQMVRTGIEPRLLTGKGWDARALSGCRGLILPPSGNPLDPEEVRQVKSFMKSGGRVLLVAGRSASAQHDGWLLGFGCGIDPEPLWFQFPVRRPDGLVGRFAGPPYETSFSGSHSLMRGLNRILLDVPRVVSGGKPFLSIAGYPVGIQRAVGAGELIIIGGEELMLDGHLEDSRKVYDPAKITFWQNLARHLAGGGSP